MQTNKPNVAEASKSDSKNRVSPAINSRSFDFIPMGIYRRFSNHTEYALFFQNGSTKNAKKFASSRPGTKKSTEVGSDEEAVFFQLPHKTQISCQDA